MNECPLPKADVYQIAVQIATVDTVLEVKFIARSWHRRVCLI